MAEGAKERNLNATADAIRDALSKPVPQDKIIEAQEAEILKLKTELPETKEKYQKVKVELDKMLLQKRKLLSSSIKPRQR